MEAAAPAQPPWSGFALSGYPADGRPPPIRSIQTSATISRRMQQSRAGGGHRFQVNGLLRQTGKVRDEGVWTYKTNSTDAAGEEGLEGSRLLRRTIIRHFDWRRRNREIFPQKTLSGNNKKETEEYSSCTAVHTRGEHGVERETSRNAEVCSGFSRFRGSGIEES
eukprot:1115594-Rhodomonas_salina.2